MGGARHPGTSGDDAHGLRPLVGISDAVTDPARHVGGLDDVHRRRRDVEADVDDADVAGQLAALAEVQTGLCRRERHRHIGAQRPGSGGSRVAVDTTRDVDRQHHRIADRRCLPGTVEAGAERGIDHEIGGWQHRGTVVDVEHANLDPSRGKSIGGDTPVGPVVPRPGDHVHDPSVRAAEHRPRDAGDGRACPIDEFLDRFGGGGVDRPHLGRGDDRNHACSV